MPYDTIPAKPTAGQNPWYAPMVAWMDAVEVALGQIDTEITTHTADTLVHVPSGGTSGQVITKGTGTIVAWATPASGVTDHGLLSGLSDPDHVIGSVSGLQTALDGKAVVGHNHTGTYDPAGTAATLVAGHEALSDPHPGYLTPTEGNAAYAPLAQAVPTGGTTGFVLTKQASGFAWAAASGGTAIASPYQLVATADGQNIFSTKAFSATHTGNLMEARLSDNTLAWAITPLQTGRIGPNVATQNGQYRIGVSDAANRGLLVKLAASQTAKAVVVTDSSNAEKFSVDKDGVIVGANLGGQYVASVVLGAADAVPAGTRNGTIVMRRPA